MSTHSTVGKDPLHPVFRGFEDIDETGHISSKSRTVDYYLYLIEPYFDRLEVFSTEGDFRTPYQFHWVAYSKLFEGHDDVYEGSGGDPREAMKNLYKSIKESFESGNA